MLSMMIRLIPKNSKPTIQLLHEEKTHHLMGKGHLRKCNLSVSPLVYIFTKTVRPTNDKD